MQTENKALSLPMLLILILTYLFFMTHTQIVYAVQTKSPTPDQQLFETIFQSGTKGPEKISLSDQAILDLPKHYVFIPAQEAADLFRLMHNEPNPDLLGIIMSDDPGQIWYISIYFYKDGYISDDDAKTFNSDKFLTSIKKHNDERNKIREEEGRSPVEILGWIEPPTYVASHHKTFYSISAKSDNVKYVNYHQLALGREGYFALSLISDNNTIEQSKSDAHAILSALHYVNGKRYEDFEQGIDRVAEYGLGALIAGVAAKKLGLLALAGAFIIKIWKFLIIIPVLLWSAIKKFFKRN